MRALNKNKILKIITKEKENIDQPTTDTPQAPAVLNVAEKFSLTTVILSRQNTVIYPNKASSYFYARQSCY